MSFLPISSISSENVTSSGSPRAYSQNGVNFTHTYIAHNCGTSEAPRTEAALYSLRVTKTHVKRKVNEQTGKMDWKLIPIIKDAGDIKGLANLDAGLLQVAYRHRVQLQHPNLNVANPAGSYRGIYFYPTDQQTAMVLEGSDPLMAMKINRLSRFEIVLDDKGHTQQVDFASLEGKELTASIIFSPQLYHKTGPGNTILAQPVIRSCLIVGMADSGIVDHHKSDDVKSFLSQNPDILASLSEEVRKLKTGPNLFQTSSATPSVSGQTIFASRPAANPMQSGTPTMIQGGGAAMYANPTMMQGGAPTMYANPAMKQGGAHSSSGDQTEPPVISAPSSIPVAGSPQPVFEIVGQQNYDMSKYFQTSGAGGVTLKKL